ncbi:MAG TPA: TIGR03000 domain-containing protein [Gemmataceae bacterium]|nr:TIGR03000 domain-containing protein [Gemmataceae bacterium]
MYSMILMAAMTTGADMPDMGRRGGGGGCCGCYGGMSYGGCYGGGYGGGWSGGWGGCYGGGWGGCYGGGRVGWGGCMGMGMSMGCGGGYGGHAWGGGYGYGGGYAWGGTMPLNGYAASPILYGSNFATPMVMGNLPFGLGTTQSFYYNPTSNSGNEATIIVHLPANARLTIDGQATQSTSGTRTFVSPPLEAGKTYTYTLRGELDRNGRMVNAKQTVDVHAGGVSEITLDFPAANQEAEQINTPPPAARNGNPANPVRTPARAPRSLPTPPNDE